MRSRQADVTLGNAAGNWNTGRKTTNMTMVNHRIGIWIGALAISAVLGCPATVRGAAADSQRLDHAKDLIGDEQWARAVDELKAAAADPKEPNKDEALFWLAHSQNQARQAAAAVETILRLERQFPASRWVKPARSLRIEIAQRLRRDDVLWYTAAPPPPPPAPAALPSTPPVAPAAPV